MEASTLAPVHERAPPLLELVGVSRLFRMGDSTVHALDRIDLRIQIGEFIAFLGASGSGKSTLMNILGCLDKPTSGHYRLKGRDVGDLEDEELSRVRNREMGFVFQSFHLLPRVSALGNVMQPLVYRGLPAPERKQRAMAALERVGLSHRMNHLPHQLSGGQRQRVAIARALCAQPSVLLADEPTGNLDSPTAADIMSLFDSLHAEGYTVLLVTHDQSLAQHATRQIELKDGRIVSERPAPGWR